MNNAKCDVIVVTYNRLEHLLELFDSLIGQVQYINKVIIYDDCSTDETRSYLNSYKGLINLELIFPKEKSPNIGFSRNIALKQVTSKYVVVLDDDDLLTPDKLKLSIEAMESTGKSWVIGNCLEFSKEGERYIKSSRNLKKVLYGNNTIRWITTFFKSEVLKTIKFNQNVKLITDWILYCDLLDKGYHPEILNRCLGMYRVHNSGISNNKKMLVKDLEYVLQGYRHWGSQLYLVRSQIIDKVISKEHINGFKILIKNLHILKLRRSLRISIFLIPGVFNHIKTKPFKEES